MDNNITNIELYNSNLFEILGIPEDSSSELIKKRYKELAKIYHPDKNQVSNPEIFMRIKDAYEILSNPE